MKKCPKCKCKEVITSSNSGGYNMPSGINEETIKCKKCGNIKYYWECGITYIKNWKELKKPICDMGLDDRLDTKIKNKCTSIKHRIKDLFSKNNQLPF